MDKAKRDTPTTSKDRAIKKKVKGGAEKLRMKNLELLKDSARQCKNISQYFPKKGNAPPPSTCTNLSENLTEEEYNDVQNEFVGVNQQLIQNEAEQGCVEDSLDLSRVDHDGRNAEDALNVAEIVDTCEVNVEDVNIVQEDAEQDVLVEGSQEAFAATSTNSVGNVDTENIGSEIAVTGK